MHTLECQVTYSFKTDKKKCSKKYYQTLTGISQLKAVQEMREDMAQDRDRFMKQSINTKLEDQQKYLITILNKSI